MLRSLRNLFAPAPRVYRSKTRRPLKPRTLRCEWLEQRQLLSISVASDLPDYAPGSTAVLTASGVGVGGTVKFEIASDTAGPGQGAWLVSDGVADGSAADLDGAANGSVSTSWLVDPDGAYIGATLIATATDLATGESATTTFTDASVVTTATLNAISTPLPTGQTGVAYSGQISASSSVPNGQTVKLQTSPDPVNVAFSDVTTTTTTSDNGSFSGTFTAPSTAGTYYFRVLFPATGNVGGNNWKNSQSASQQVTVQSANTAPTITSNGGGATAAVSAAENQTAVTTVTASDPDAGDTQTFSLSGADAGLFSISVGGVLTFALAPNFEARADADLNGVYEVTVTVTDAGGLTDSQVISVTVTDVQYDATISVTGYNVTYNGNAHTATGTATGANEEDLSAFLDLSGTTHTNAGSYADTWTFAANGDYNSASGTVADSIAKADATVVVSGYTGGTYDGNAHTQTVTVTGVGGDGQLFTDSLTGTNAGPYSKAWSYSSDNYNFVDGTLAFDIAKAAPSVSYSGYAGGTYDGDAHTRTATISGVAVDGVLETFDLNGTNAGSYSDGGTYTDPSGNYNDAVWALGFTIDKADAAISVSGYTGVYDGNTHGATGSATGVKGEALAGLDLGASFTNVPGGTANWTFTDTTGNYNDASGSVAIVINALSLDEFASASTQAALNLAKLGTVSFAIAVDRSGIVDGQTVANLFDGATFTLKIEGYEGTVTAEATVIDNIVYVNLRMNQELYTFLKQAWLSTEINASKASWETITLSATSNDNNYTISAEALTRIFQAGKVTFV